MHTAAAVSLTGQTFEDTDFSGQDLSEQDLSGSKFTRCKFDGADMSRANCEGSDFSGSSFRQTILSYTNFRNAWLGTTIFEPSDCYGMTITMDCRTFRNMHVSKLYWLCLMVLASQMALDFDPDEDLKAKLIELIGAERYARLAYRFSCRDY